MLDISPMIASFTRQGFMNPGVQAVAPVALEPERLVIRPMEGGDVFTTMQTVTEQVKSHFWDRGVAIPIHFNCSHWKMFVHRQSPEFNFFKLGAVDVIAREAGARSFIRGHRVDLMAPDSALFLAEALKDPEAHIGHVAEQLRKLGDRRAVPAFLELIGAPDWPQPVAWAMDNIARALGASRDKKAVGPMIAALEKHPSQGWPLAGALATLGAADHPLVFETLLDLLFHQPALAEDASHCLTMLRHRKSVRACLDRLEKAPFSEKNVQPIQGLFHVLTKTLRSEKSPVSPVLGVEPGDVKRMIGDLEAREPSAGAAAARGNFEGLVRALDERGVFDPYSHRRIRWALARQLGLSRDHSLVDPLKSALDRQEDFGRICVLLALGMIGGKGALYRLLEALDTGAPGVRTAAAWALGRVADERATEFLERFLDGGLDPVSKEIARSAVKKIRSRNEPWD